MIFEYVRKSNRERMTITLTDFAAVSSYALYPHQHFAIVEYVSTHHYRRPRSSFSLLALSSSMFVFSLTPIRDTSTRWSQQSDIMTPRSRFSLCVLCCLSLCKCVRDSNANRSSPGRSPASLFSCLSFSFSFISHSNKRSRGLVSYTSLSTCSLIERSVIWVWRNIVEKMISFSQIDEKYVTTGEKLCHKFKFWISVSTRLRTSTLPIEFAG